MLTPKKVKYRKWHKGRGRNKRIASRRTNLDFGAFGLKAMSHAWIDSRQIEAARRAIVHHFKKGGKLWIRIFPDQSVTFKGSEIPMGGGKGSVDHYVAPVRPGTVVLEVDGVSEELATEALRLAGHKLPVLTKIIRKE